MYSLIIVDDEAYMLERLGSIFHWNEMGFSLEGCFGGVEDALAYLVRHKVDVLMTDIQLGGASGLHLAAEARKLRPDIELVILSAHSNFEYAHTALRISAYDYLLKPVTYEDVTSCFAGLREKLEAQHLSDETSAPPPPLSEEADYRMKLVKSYIEKHVGEDITLENMSALVFMNPAYFSRYFKRHAGVNFVDYLTGRRMEKAIDLLRDPRYRVFEVCAMVGYFSKQNFYKRFRQYTGRTPAEYRNEVLQIQDEDDEEA